MTCDNDPVSAGSSPVVSSPSPPLILPDDSDVHYNMTMIPATYQVGSPAHAAATKDVVAAATGGPASDGAKQFVADTKANTGWSQADINAVVGSTMGAASLGLQYLLTNQLIGQQAKQRVVTPKMMSQPLPQPRPVVNDMSFVWKAVIGLTVVGGAMFLLLRRR